MKTNQGLDLGNAAAPPDATVTITRDGSGRMAFTDADVPGGAILSSGATALATHAADTTAIHGITDTTDLALKSGGLDEFGEVVITAVGNDEVLAYDTGTSKWINQTAAEAGLATSGHTIVSHDTTGTGAELTTLTDGSNADALHVHTGFVATDGDTMTDALIFNTLAGTRALDLRTDGLNLVTDFHIDISATNFWRGDGAMSISGDLTVLGNPVFSKDDGILVLGADDLARASLYIYGDAASDNALIRLYNGADNDGAIDYWTLDPQATDFYIGTDADAVLHKFSSNGDVTIKGDFVMATGKTATIETVQAVDATGLQLLEDGGLGMTVTNTTGDVVFDAGITMVTGKTLTAETIKAVDATGLLLQEDGGLGITIADATGNVTLDGDILVNGNGITTPGSMQVNSGGVINLITAAANAMSLICGTLVQFRDVDDGNATRMTFNSSTSQLILLDGTTAGKGGFITMAYRDADPADPGAGNGSIWFSDGTGSGANGDLMMISNNGVGTATQVVATHA